MKNKILKTAGLLAAAAVSAVGFIYCKKIDIKNIPHRQETAELTGESKPVAVKSKVVSEYFYTEDEVKKIRERYNDTQSRLDSFEKRTVSGGITEYYDNSELVRADIAAGEKPYTKFYYFKDGRLYFAFIFNGTNENRLYFKNGKLFRWIDENKNTHDSEFDNGSYVSWEAEALNDAARIMQ